MSLKTSDLGQFLTVKILVKKFLGSDHSVALFEVLKNRVFRLFKIKAIAYRNFSLLVFFSDSQKNFAPEWHLTFYVLKFPRGVGPEMVVPKKSIMSNYWFEICKRCAIIDFVKTVLATMGLRWPQVVLAAMPWFGGVDSNTVYSIYRKAHCKK